MPVASRPYHTLYLAQAGAHLCSLLSSHLPTDLLAPLASFRARRAEASAGACKLEAATSAPAFDAFVPSFGGVEGTLNRLLTTPTLADAAARQDLLEAEAGTLAASTDPYVVLARALAQRLAPLASHTRPHLHFYHITHLHLPVVINLVPAGTGGHQGHPRRHVVQP